MGEMSEPGQLKNKANFRHDADREIGVPRRPRVRSKANSRPRGAGTGLGGADRLRIADCGLNTELRRSRVPFLQLKCTNKPNWPTARLWRGTSLRYKQSQFPTLCRSGDRRSQGPRVRNKPNFGELADGRNTQYSTIPSFQHSNPMPVVRNKANVCEAGWLMGRAKTIGKLRRLRLPLPPLVWTFPGLAGEQPGGLSGGRATTIMAGA